MKKRDTYIIAEIGQNYNGSLENCYKLIDVSKAAGCDAAKFQFFRASRLYPKYAGNLKWGDEGKKYEYDVYNAVKKIEFPEKWIKKVVLYGKKKKIDILFSVFDKRSADILKKNDVKDLKISSYSINDIELLRHCAKIGRNIILSTGCSYLSEVARAVENIVRINPNLTLLQCTAKYPASLREVNLGVIETYKKAFPKVKTGFSDHTKETFQAPVAAVMLGAEVIEKHITLAKDMEGTDHFFALDPDELKIMVKKIREAEKERLTGSFEIDHKTIGTTEKKLNKYEEELRDLCKPLLFVVRGVRKGERIKDKDLRVLRASGQKSGIRPEDISLFKKNVIIAQKDILSGTAIKGGDIFKRNINV